MTQNNESYNLDLTIESVRLAYASNILSYLNRFKKYEQFKKRIYQEELKKYFQTEDTYYYDSSGTINWDNIRSLMPSHLEKSIKDEYNMLNDTEIRICCLLLFGISCKDIAHILSYTQTSIHSKTHIIRKKTGIKDIKTALKKSVFIITGLLILLLSVTLLPLVS